MDYLEIQNLVSLATHTLNPCDRIWMDRFPLYASHKLTDTELARISLIRAIICRPQGASTDTRVSHTKALETFSLLDETSDDCA